MALHSNGAGSHVRRSSAGTGTGTTARRSRTVKGTNAVKVEQRRGGFSQQRTQQGGDEVRVVNVRQVTVSGVVRSGDECTQLRDVAGAAKQSRRRVAFGAEVLHRRTLQPLQRRRRRVRFFAFHHCRTHTWPQQVHTQGNVCCVKCTGAKRTPTHSREAQRCEQGQVQRSAVWGSLEAGRKRCRGNWVQRVWGGGSSHSRRQPAVSRHTAPRRAVRTSGPHCHTLYTVTAALQTAANSTHCAPGRSGETHGKTVAQSRLIVLANRVCISGLIEHVEVFFLRVAAVCCGCVWVSGGVRVRAVPPGSSVLHPSDAPAAVSAPGLPAVSSSVRP